MCGIPLNPCYWLCYWFMLLIIRFNVTDVNSDALRRHTHNRKMDIVSDTQEGWNRDEVAPNKLSDALAKFQCGKLIDDWLPDEGLRLCRKTLLEFLVTMWEVPTLNTKLIPCSPPKLNQLVRHTARYMCGIPLNPWTDRVEPTWRRHTKKYNSTVQIFCISSPSINSNYRVQVSSPRMQSKYQVQVSSPSTKS